MEATLRAKRAAVFNISKLLHPIQRTTRACLSTSFAPPQGSNSTEVEVKRHQPLKTVEGPPPPAPLQGSSRAEDTAKDGIKTAEDTTKDGIKKTVEMAENVADSAKETLDGAWKAAKDTAKVVKDNVTGRSSDDDDDDKLIDEVKSIDELRAKAGGYDKAP